MCLYNYFTKHIELQIIRNVLFLSTRWRNSFLFGLAFGVPAMGVMMYFMWYMSTKCHNISMTVGNTSLVGHNTSSVCSGDVMLTTMCASNMFMVVHGLSLKNLLLFIFCTPCQVDFTCFCSPFTLHNVWLQIKNYLFNVFNKYTHSFTF